MIDIKKALTTADGTDTIIPERLDAVLVEEANLLTPLREFLTRIPWSTNAYEWNARTALPGGTNSKFYNETDTITDAESTYVRRVEIIRMLKQEGNVSQLLQDTSKDYINALQSEIQGALRSLIQGEEDELINGNEDTADNFDGLIQQIITNEVDAAGVVISLDMIDEALLACQNAGGSPDLIVVSYRDHMKLNQIMRGMQSYEWITYETKAGTKLVTYSGIPIMGSAHIPITGSYGTTPTLDHSTLLVLDTSQIVVPVVRDVTYEEVPSTTDGTSFRLKIYETIAMKSQRTSAKIVNIADPF